jgi:hypothetical protein
LGTGDTGQRTADSRGRTSFIEDSAKASVEEITRAFISSMSPAALIAEAKKKSDIIMGGVAAGPRHHNAVVDTLFELMEAMQKRIEAAPVDKKTLLPVLPGVKWDPDDPLAPLVEILDPFMLCDFWTKIPVPTEPVTRKAPRRRRPPPSPKGSAGKKKDSRSHIDPSKAGTKGIAGQLKPSKEDPRTRVLKEGAQALAEDMIGSASMALNLLLLAKTAYDYLKAWVYAKQQGLAVAERRVAATVMADGIASMALKLGPPNRTEKQPAAGGFQPPGILPWQGVRLPDPDASGVKQDLQQILGGRLWNKREDVKRVVKKGRAMGLNDQKKSGDGHLFLWALKAKYKHRWAIRRYLVGAIRRDLKGGK